MSDETPGSGPSALAAGLPQEEPGPETGTTGSGPSAWQDLVETGEAVPPTAVRPASSAFSGRETPGFLLDVRLTLSVEVGRVQMPVREVMELGAGSVVELQRAAGEPVEIHANGRCIGHGEIVVVGDQFGVRITELGGAA